MAKLGRKPKEGLRYESGRLMPPERRDGPPPGLVARQTVITRQSADSKWGSKLGLLYLEELITAPEMRAGFAYGAFRARFDAVMGMPRRSTQAMCYGDARKATPRDLTEDEIHRLRERHADLIGVIGGVRTLLDAVCCEDRQPAAGDILRLRVALRLIQPWFGVEEI
jgi:hypothetical protein